MAKVCKSQNKPRRIHKVTEDFDEENDLDSDDSIYQLQGAVKRQYFVKVELSTENGPAQVKCQLDTGASCSTLTVADYKRITKESQQPDCVYMMEL